jgi:hypothetical protein
MDIVPVVFESSRFSFPARLHAFYVFGLSVSGSRHCPRLRAWRVFSCFAIHLPVPRRQLNILSDIARNASRHPDRMKVDTFGQALHTAERAQLISSRYENRWKNSWHPADTQKLFSQQGTIKTGIGRAIAARGPSVLMPFCNLLS